MTDAGERCIRIQAAACDLLNSGETPSLAAVRRILRARFRRTPLPDVVDYEVAILGAGLVGVGWERMTAEERRAAREADPDRPSWEEFRIWKWLRQWPSEEARNEAVRRLAFEPEAKRSGS